MDPELPAALSAPSGSTEAALPPTLPYFGNARGQRGQGLISPLQILRFLQK